MPQLEAFFYGTLMHPKILERVIGHDGFYLKVCPAVLLDYTRHQVKHADYPGIVPWSDSHNFFKLDNLTSDERSVRGTLVQGLDSRDIYLLDIFEGQEYARKRVQVHPLSNFVPLREYSNSELVPANPPPIPSALPPALEAETYVYNDIENLESNLWSFATFVRENAWQWHGPSASRHDIFEVDKARAGLEQNL